MNTTELTAAGGKITAARAGNGRDLVALHSLLTDRHAFDPVLAELSKRHRVTLINLPGFHGSKPVEASMDAYVAFVRVAFDAFQIGRDAILMGNGYGGTVVLAFAIAHGDRIGRLLLCDVAAGFPPEGKQAFRIMSKKVASGGLGTIADIAANRVFHAAYLAQHPQALAERRAVLLGIDPMAFRAACTVLIDDLPVSACTTLAYEARGKNVTTIEGLERPDGTLHPLQQAFIDEFAFQCGFCTPGMIMTAIDMLRRNPKPDEETVRHELEGNFCRCTGYVNIVKAIQAVAGAQ